MEFSGRLLVRPLQPEPSLQRSDHSAAERDSRARKIIATHVLDYIEELDEYVVAIPPGEDENSFGARLLATGLYEFVCPDWILYVVGHGTTPDDPGFPQQWHLDKIEAPWAWNISHGAPGPVIAIVDTGADVDHPDLAGILVSGYNCHFTSRRSEDAGGVVTDMNGHGTAVAGAAAAAGNNGLGGCGVGWDLRVMPVRATNPTTSVGSANSQDIQNGALWASNHGAKVISVSFAGGALPYVQTLGTTLRSRGCLLVWAMDANGISYSEDHSNAIMVTGTKADDAHDPGTSFGPLVDIAAPSNNLWLPNLGGGYGWHTGPSFAAPQVAAAAAMIWNLAPGFSPAEVEKVLYAGADDYGAAGDDSTFGAGRLNLRWALWLAVVRQFTKGVPAPGANLDGIGVDDLYTLQKTPRDVDGNGIIDDGDRDWTHLLLRADELKQLSSDRP